MTTNAKEELDQKTQDLLVRYGYEYEDFKEMSTFDIFEELLQMTNDLAFATCPRCNKIFEQ